MSTTEAQSIEQCAFTPGVRLENAMCTVEVAIQHSSEFRKPLWLLSMDMRKAFDTVDHESLLHALQHQGIANEYIALIASLYKSQNASVNGSREFSVGRGVKQGDVLSTLLFNCVLDVAFQRFKANLTNEGLFISNDQLRLTNIRYADDILLFSNSLEELVLMSEMLLREFNAIGLKLNAEKTKILHSDLVDDGANVSFIDINDELIEVLEPSKSHKYLGKILSIFN